jgi:hypothetical protein
MLYFFFELKKSVVFFIQQSLQDKRHTFDKVHYKKDNIQQTIDERDELIDQLLAISLDLNDKVR